MKGGIDVEFFALMFVDMNLVFLGSEGLSDGVGDTGMPLSSSKNGDSWCFFHWRQFSRRVCLRRGGLEGFFLFLVG